MYVLTSLSWLNARWVFGVKWARHELPGGEPASSSYTAKQHPTWVHPAVSEKVKGHFTIVCGYINVSSDLRQESGLCSKASRGQIGADRQAWPYYRVCCLFFSHLFYCSLYVYCNLFFLLCQSCPPPHLSVSYMYHIPRLPTSYFT